jgi:cytochrome c-type biogenesis protein CcmH/NrfG
LFGYYSRFYGGFLSSLAFSLLYWAFVSHANRSFVRTVLIFLLSSSALVSLWAIFEHFGHSASCFLITGQFTDSCWVQDVQERVFATLGQPNWLAAYVVALLPLSWAFGLHSTTKKLVEKSFILPVILSGLLYSTLLFTKSRSGFVAFVFAFLVFWFGTFFSTFFRNRLFFIKSISSILVIISLSFVFGTPWTPSFSQLFEKTPPLSESVSEVQVPVLERGGTESGVIRQIVWQGAVQVFLHNPLFGTGLETFAYSYYQYRPISHNTTSEWDFLYNKAHNEYLNILANSGSVGFLTSLIVIGISLSIFIRKFFFSTPLSSIFTRPNIKSSQKNFQAFQEHSVFYIALFSGFITILVTNFFGFSVVSIGLLFFLFPAFSVGYGIQQKQSSDTQIYWNMLSRVQQLSIILVTFIGGLGLYMLFSYWHADQLYAAGKSYNRSLEFSSAIESLQQALSSFPSEPLYLSELAQSYTDASIALSEAHESTVSAQLEQEAILSMSDAVSISPRNVTLRRSQANIYMQLGVLDKNNLYLASQVLVQTRALSPTDPKLPFYLGLTAVRLGDVEKGLSYLEEAITLKPDYKEARESAALIYKDRKEYDKARAHWEYILQYISSKDEAIQTLLSTLPKQKK